MQRRCRESAFRPGKPEGKQPAAPQGAAPYSGFAGAKRLIESKFEIQDMKHALVTGGSRGIGRAVSLRLAKEGYCVSINYLSNKAAAEETLALVEEEGGSGELWPFDVSDPEQAAAFFGSWKEKHADAHVEVLVHNAGIRKDNLLMWMQRQEWDQVLDTNLRSFFNVVQPLLVPMMAGKFGRIVSIASLSGLKGMPGQANYSAAKGGLIAATKALAQEVARKGVTVNAVAPGFISTDMTADLDEKELKKLIPAGRFGRAEEVADLVAFLISEKASYITGEVISINGGLYT